MIHVAVLLSRYIDAVLEGSKRIECRLTQQSRAPFEAIERGDRIYIKQSAGPFRAVASAGQTLFEADLTPKRVAQLRRSYDESIRGDDDFWRSRRASRFASLIWLQGVRPIDHGPAIRPLQGVAWLSLPNEPAWRRADRLEHSFTVGITAGNLRNRTLYATRMLDHFPADALGGPTRSDAARPVTLRLYGGPTVRTDIVADRNLFRTRIWGDWFRRHGARAGDRVIFTPLGRRIFEVGLLRA